MALVNRGLESGRTWESPSRHRPSPDSGIDEENRMTRLDSVAQVSTYAYDGDNLKRLEIATDISQDPPTLAVTTIIWDGTDYLGEIT